MIFSYGSYRIWTIRLEFCHARTHQYRITSIRFSSSMVISRVKIHLTGVFFFFITRENREKTASNLTVRIGRGNHRIHDYEYDLWSISGWLVCIYTREISVRRYWSMEREVKRAVLIRIGPVCSVVFASLRNYPCSVFVSHDVSMYPPPRFIDIVIGRFAWNANPPFVDLPSQSSVFRQLFTRRSTTSSGGRGEGEWGVGRGENSRRSSVTIRIFWAVFYTRTYI